MATNRAEVLDKALMRAGRFDLAAVAQRTSGFVGADLANITNEAAILAVRNNHDAAIDRVIAGPEKKHRVMSTEEKRRVAFHEPGHALVARAVPTGEPVH